jgi:hypothetical protein
LKIATIIEEGGLEGKAVTLLELWGSKRFLNQRIAQME